jgi:hypothetical protein
MGFLGNEYLEPAAADEDGNRAATANRRPALGFPSL